MNTCHCIQHWTVARNIHLWMTHFAVLKIGAPPVVIMPYSISRTASTSHHFHKACSYKLADNISNEHYWYIKRLSRNLSDTVLPGTSTGHLNNSQLSHASVGVRDVPAFNDTVTEDVKRELIVFLDNEYVPVKVVDLYSQIRQLDAEQVTVSDTLIADNKLYSC